VVCFSKDVKVPVKVRRALSSVGTSSSNSKFDWLKTKGIGGAKSPDNKKIVAMMTPLNALKDQLKLDLKLSTIADKGKKWNNKRRQKKNKKNRSNCVQEKKDEVWKKVTPKDGKKKEKQVGRYTYHCVCVCVNLTSGREKKLTTPTCQGRLALVSFPLGAAVKRIEDATLRHPLLREGHHTAASH
jgi:hypothetical protein